MDACFTYIAIFLSVYLLLYNFHNFPKKKINSKKILFSLHKLDKLIRKFDEGYYNLTTNNLKNNNYIHNKSQ